LTRVTTSSFASWSADILPISGLPTGQNVSNPFRAGPLTVLPLQVARGHVVDGDDRGDPVDRLGFGHVPQAPSDDDSDLALELHLRRLRRERSTRPPSMRLDDGREDQRLRRHFVPKLRACSR
jgi:hypothetical protein